MQCRNYEILQNGILFRGRERVPPILLRRNSITLLKDLCDGFCPRDEMFIVFRTVLSFLLLFLLLLFLLLFSFSSFFPFLDNQMVRIIIWIRIPASFLGLTLENVPVPNVGSWNSYF